MGGRLNAAARAYQEIIRRKPRQFEARYQLGNLLKLASDSITFKLRRDMERAPPPGTSIRQWRKHLSELQGQSTKYSQLALSELGMALGIRPSELGAVRQVSEIYRRSGRLADAQRYYQWLALREPDHWMHLYRLGTILIELERYEDAIHSLKQAVALAPSEGDCYFALGLAYVRADRLADAINTLQRGTIYQPFSPALYTNLGAAYASVGRYGLARNALERSLQLGNFSLPRVHLAHTNLALVHLKQGRRDQAVNALKNALHIFPDYTYARNLLERAKSRTRPGTLDVTDRGEFVFNDLLESFGEVTTVTFDNE